MRLLRLLDEMMQPGPRILRISTERAKPIEVYFDPFSLLQRKMSTCRSHNMIVLAMLILPANQDDRRTVNIIDSHAAST